MKNSSGLGRANVPTRGRKDKQDVVDETIKKYAMGMATPVPSGRRLRRCAGSWHSPGRRVLLEGFAPAVGGGRGLGFATSEKRLDAVALLVLLVVGDRCRPVQALVQEVLSAHLLAQAGQKRCRKEVDPQTKCSRRISVWQFRNVTDTQTLVEGGMKNHINEYTHTPDSSTLSNGVATAVRS